MTNSPNAKGTSLVALPSELQELIYQHLYPDTWSFHVHSYHLNAKDCRNTHTKSNSKKSDRISASCTDPEHSSNPSNALLLTCKTVSRIALSVLYRTYNGNISICSDTIAQCETFVPDLSASDFVSVVARNHLLNSKTCTLTLPLDQIKTQFANCLWYEMQYGPHSDLLLNLKSITLKDELFCSIGEYYGRIRYGTMRPSGHQIEGTGFSTDQNFLNLLYPCLARCRFNEVLSEGWSFEDELEHAAPMHQSNWIPRSAKYYAGNVGNLSHVPTFYRVKFRIEEKQDEAYEAKFVIERREPFFDQVQMKVIDKLSLIEVRSLSIQEDSEVDWWTATEVDLVQVGFYESVRAQSEPMWRGKGSKLWRSEIEYNLL